MRGRVRPGGSPAGTGAALGGTGDHEGGEVDARHHDVVDR
jgi:hypothetical protein